MEVVLEVVTVRRALTMAVEEAVAAFTVVARGPILINNSAAEALVAPVHSNVV